MMKKGITSKASPINKFESPDETSCLGFNLTEPSYKFLDGYFYLSAGFLHVSESNAETCEVLRNKFKDGPFKMA